MDIKPATCIMNDFVFVLAELREVMSLVP